MFGINFFQNRYITRKTVKRRAIKQLLSRTELMTYFEVLVAVSEVYEIQPKLNR